MKPIVIVFLLNYIRHAEALSRIPDDASRNPELLPKLMTMNLDIVLFDGLVSQVWITLDQGFSVYELQWCGSDSR